MRIRILGSAAGGGFPQWNCRCPVCELAWKGDRRVRPRSQSGLAVSADGERLQVSVKDRGEAIPVERQQAIFEPYARNDQSGQRGAGLGLALCRAIAAAHGGSLTLKARQGGGNNFSFALALSPQQPALDATMV